MKQHTAAWVFGVVFFCVVTCLCQEGPPATEVLNAKIPEFRLADATILAGLVELSRLTPTAAFGFEEVLRAKQEKPPGAQVRFTLALKDATVREILDRLCSSDDRYTWSMDERVVNVYPRATAGDTGYLLNQKLARVQMTAVPDPFEALTPIARQLPREQIGYAQVGGGDGGYEKPWTATLEGLTVRQVINRAAQQLGPRGSWTFHGSIDFRTFAFFRNAFTQLQPH